MIRRLIPLCVAAAIMAPHTAHAISKNVSSPSVTEGELTLKNRGTVEWDDEDDSLWKNKAEAEYGINMHFKVGIAGEIQKYEDDSLDYTTTELKAVYKFTDDSSSLQSALQGAYKIDHDGGADEIEAKLLLAGSAYGLAHKANIALAHEIGEDADNGFGVGLAWGSYYQVNDMFDIGGEYYGDFGNLDDNNDYNEQEHHIGPVVGIELPIGNRTIDTRLGYLVGISSAASDNVVKYELQSDF